MGSTKPRRDFPKAKIDLPDFTLAIPYAMPSLFLLATLGCAVACMTLPATRRAVAAVWISVLPLTFALLAAVATAQRYTGDFCPFLITAAVFGLAAVDRLRSGWRLASQAILGLSTLAAIAVTVALTLHYQGAYLWGVPEQARWNYQHLRHCMDAFFGLA